MQENEKRDQNKKKEKKNHAKQCHHKYEICLMEMILKIRIQLCISQMYDYVFNEEEKKRKRR